jgi:NitT/TauT family transport system ATP-binding protein
MPTPAIGSTVQIGALSKYYGKRRVLGPIDFAIESGEVVSWIGASGCGKTTLLRIVAGLETPTSGSITIGNMTPLQACRNREIGVAFQRSALIPSRTALQNVKLTLEICKNRPALDPEQLLKEFGLGDFMHHHPHKLSGGMQQRVNIACAMVHQPKLVLLDEPFGALDELTRASMAAWLADVLVATRQTVVLVTHSVEEAVTLSDRICIFSRTGEIAEVLPVNLDRPRASVDDEALIREIARIRGVLRKVLGASRELVV